MKFFFSNIMIVEIERSKIKLMLSVITHTHYLSIFLSISVCAFLLPIEKTSK